MTLLEKNVSSFLDQHYIAPAPVLLALSGGTDSMTLLHLLLKYKEQKSFKFAIAHIDHKWRPESTQEALQLKELADALSISFHLITLDPHTLQGNLEAACRHERLKFYQELCQKHNYQAVLLAHHADDQAETVLKRVLEGTTIDSLGALEEIAVVNDVNLWRPLLKVTKKQLQAWLDENQLTAFDDYTNFDPKFLRGRFRTEIIPQLSTSFGKEVSLSLCHLAEEAKELRRYFQSTLDPFLERIEKGPFGTLFDLSQDSPDASFAIKYLIRQFLRQQDICPSRQIIEAAYQMFLKNKGDLQLDLGGRVLHIDRKKLFLLKESSETPPEVLFVKPGSYVYGSWEINVDKDSKAKQSKSGWKHAWNGLLEVSVPANEYQLGPAKMSASYWGGSSISRLWTNDKVPAFLRNRVPVLWANDKIAHEFLTDRSASTQDCSAFITIRLQAH